jgi:hypothetical protein
MPALPSGVPGPGIVYSTGYVFGAADLAGGLAWDAETATLAIVGPLTWAQLPAEAQNFPLLISLAGRPPAGARILFSLPQGYVIPENWAGTTTIVDVAPDSARTFSFSIIRGGAETDFGTITIPTTGGVNNTLSEQAAYPTDVADALVLTTPAEEDANMSGLGIAILLQKV